MTPFMDRRAFFKWLPVMPLALVQAPSEPRPVKAAGEVVTAEEWNAMVERQYRILERYGTP